MKLKKSISLAFCTLTVALLTLSLIVHVSLYAGFNTRDEFPLVWTFLKYAIVIGFIPSAGTYLLMRLGIVKRRPAYIWGSAQYEERSSWEVYGEMMVGTAIVFLCLYAVLNNIYWCDVVLKLLRPYALNGKYFAYHLRSMRIRTLTDEEYKVMSLYFARGASGHWMALHSIALAIWYGDWFDRAAAPKG